MIIYLIVFWLLVLAALLGQLKLTQGARWTLFVLSYLLLVALVGLRWETGNDWPNYYNYYKHLTSLRDQPVNQVFEVGYRIFSLLVKDTGLPYAGFNVIYAAVYLGLIFLSFKHENFTVSGWLVLQLYAPFIFGLMGTTRQVMALAICMFSVRYLLSKEWLKFLFCVGIATSFHISALVFLISWPVAQFRLNLRRTWIIFAVLILASVLNLGDLAVKSAEKHLAILQLADLENRLLLEAASSPAEFDLAAGAAAPILTAVGRVGVLVVFILCFRYYTEESDKLYFKLYLVSILIVVLLSGSVYVLSERSAIYFGMFQIHLLALLTRRIKIPLLRKLFWAALLALSITRLWTGTHSARPRIFVPYKGVFINQDVRRDPGWF